MDENKLGIVGSGNGVRKNPAFIKIVEKKFGRTLKVPLHTEEAAFGAALYGLVCCGAYKNAHEAQKLISYIE